jgi:hypothetical protein
MCHIRTLYANRTAVILPPSFTFFTDRAGSDDFWARPVVRETAAGPPFHRLWRHCHTPSAAKLFPPCELAIAKGGGGSRVDETLCRAGTVRGASKACPGPDNLRNPLSVMVLRPFYTPAPKDGLPCACSRADC